MMSWWSRAVTARLGRWCAFLVELSGKVGAIYACGLATLALRGEGDC
jgi:hypothetical protein